MSRLLKHLKAKNAEIRNQISLFEKKNTILNCHFVREKLKKANAPFDRISSWLLIRQILEDLLNIIRIYKAELAFYIFICCRKAV